MKDLDPVLIYYKTVRAKKSTQGKQNTEKRSEFAAQHSKQNELTPRQPEKITAAK